MQSLSEIVETHCHLDYLKDQPVEQIIENAQLAGVGKFITISVDQENLEQVIQLTHQFSNVYGSQGIHPHQAKTYNQEIELRIKQQAQNPKIVAIGETGLDYHYDFSTPQEQDFAFRSQFELSLELNLPLIIHSRKAEEDTISILKQYAPQSQRKGVLHSFTSRWELAECALELDFYIGINGIITFKNAQDLVEVVKKIPLNRLLLETDAPYLAPTPHRGKENSPAYLPLIAQKIAQIKEITSAEVITQTTENAYQLFRLN